MHSIREQGADPYLIFYLGPKGSGKTHLAVKKLAISPRTLIVSALSSSFCRHYAHAFDRPKMVGVSALFWPRDVRSVGVDYCLNAILGEQRYDRLFFHSLPLLADSVQDKNRLPQIHANLSMKRNTDIVTTLDSSNEKETLEFELRLMSSHNDTEGRIALSMPYPHENIRFLRLSSKSISPDKRSCPIENVLTTKNLKEFL